VSSRRDKEENEVATRASRREPPATQPELRESTRSKASRDACFFGGLVYEKGRRTNHVGVPVERLDATEKLLVVTEWDEDLGVVADRGLENGEWALGDLVLLELPDLGFGKLGFGHVKELAGSG
jgi:hypothetical protein